MESRKETVMKNSWKLCVAAGSFMMFAVLGVLVILGHTTSSADSEQKTFQTSQSVTGGGVTGESVTDNGTTDKSVSGGSITDKATSKGKKNRKEKDAAKKDPFEEDGTTIQASIGKVIEDVEDQSLGAEIAYYARRFLGIRYVYGGTDLPSIESIAYCYFKEGKKGDAMDSAAIEEANKKIFGGEYGRFLWLCQNSLFAFWHQDAAFLCEAGRGGEGHTDKGKGCPAGRYSLLWYQ